MPTRNPSISMDPYSQTLAHGQFPYVAQGPAGQYLCPQPVSYGQFEYWQPFPHVNQRTSWNTPQFKTELAYVESQIGILKSLCKNNAALLEALLDSTPPDSLVFSKLTQNQLSVHYQNSILGCLEFTLENMKAMLQYDFQNKLHELDQINQKLQMQIQEMQSQPGVAHSASGSTLADDIAKELKDQFLQKEIALKAELRRKFDAFTEKQKQHYADAVNHVREHDQTVRKQLQEENEQVVNSLREEMSKNQQKHETECHQLRTKIKTLEAKAQQTVGAHVRKVADLKMRIDILETAHKSVKLQAASKLDQMKSIDTQTCPVLLTEVSVQTNGVKKSQKTTQTLAADKEDQNTQTLAVEMQEQVPLIFNVNQQEQCMQVNNENNKNDESQQTDLYPCLVERVDDDIQTCMPGIKIEQIVLSSEGSQKLFLDVDIAELDDLLDPKYDSDASEKALQSAKVKPTKKKGSKSKKQKGLSKAALAEAQRRAELEALERELEKQRQEKGQAELAKRIERRLEQAEFRAAMQYSMHETLLREADQICEDVMSFQNMRGIAKSLKIEDLD